MKKASLHFSQAEKAETPWFDHFSSQANKSLKHTNFTKCSNERIYFFLTQSCGKRNRKSKIDRLNSKTIRFDQKKWKDNLVLHYLISKWIFFLITFRRHQDLQILISPKSLILQTKKFLENDARIQKWLKRLGFCRKV